jgi:hypothetical protein
MRKGQVLPLSVFEILLQRWANTGADRSDSRAGDHQHRKLYSMYTETRLIDTRLFKVSLSRIDRRHQNLKS